MINYRIFDGNAKFTRDGAAGLELVFRHITSFLVGALLGMNVGGLGDGLSVGL